MVVMYPKYVLEDFRREANKKKKRFKEKIKEIEALGENATDQEKSFARSLTTLMKPHPQP